MPEPFIHPSAIVEPGAVIGSGTKVWHWAHIRASAKIGENCILAKSVFVDTDVQIGNNVKIQNNVSVYHGVEIEDGVFVGPHVCFTNDLYPRAITPEGDLRRPQEWVVAKTKVEYGAALGANSTVVAGTTIGRWAMIGAGSVVTKNVPPYALALGNPARIVGVVAPGGEIVSRNYRAGRYQSSDGKHSFEI